MIAFLAVLPFEFLLRKLNIKYNCRLVTTDRHPLFETVRSSDSYSFYDKLIQLCCPTPHVVFYLTGDPEALWKRKKEHSMEVYLSKKDTLESLISINSKNIDIHRINTCKTKDEVFSEIKSHCQKMGLLS